MKNITKLFAIAIVVLGFATTSFAQNTATATSSATIITPIAISKTTDMNFGNIVAGAAGTVALSVTNNRTATGVTLPTATPGTVSAAVFTVTGLANSTYSISLPAAFTITGAGTPMTVDNFVSTPTPTGVLALGTQVLTVGATLHVAANQAAGLYTNPTGLTVTVNYN